MIEFRITFGQQYRQRPSPLMGARPPRRVADAEWARWCPRGELDRLATAGVS